MGASKIEDSSKLGQAMKGRKGVRPLGKRPKNPISPFFSEQLADHPTVNRQNLTGDVAGGFAGEK